MIGYAQLDGVWYIVEIDRVNGRLVGRIRGRARGISRSCQCMRALYCHVHYDMVLEIFRVRLDCGEDADVLVVTKGGKSIDYFGDRSFRRAAVFAFTLLFVAACAVLVSVWR